MASLAFALPSASTLPTRASCFPKSSFVSAQGTVVLARNFRRARLVIKAAAGEPLNDSELLSKEFILLSSVAGAPRVQKAEEKKIRELVAMLEKSVDKNAEPLYSIDGMWRLVYTTGNLPPSLPPFVKVLGVYQRIAIDQRRLENIIHCSLSGPLGLFETTFNITLGANLDGTSVELVDAVFSFDNKMSGNMTRLPSLDLSAFTPKGALVNTYVSERMRIGRGDRGELRIFVRDSFDSSSQPLEKPSFVASVV